jgi:hypothetical protein
MKLEGNAEKKGKKVERKRERKKNERKSVHILECCYHTARHRHSTVPKGILGLLLSIVCCRYRFVRVIVLRGDGVRFDGYCFGIGPTSSVQL